MTSADKDGSIHGYLTAKCESLRRFFMAKYGHPWQRSVAALLGQRTCPVWLQVPGRYVKSVAALQRVEEAALSVGYHPSLVLVQPLFGRSGARVRT